MDKPREKDIKKINTIPNLLKDFPIKNFMGNPPPCN